MLKSSTCCKFHRTFALVVIAFMVASMLTACGPEPTATSAPPTAAPAATATSAPESAEVWLGNSIRSLSNPYHAQWNAAGEKFAEDTGRADTYQVLLSEGDNTKQLDDIKALIAKSGGNVVFNVDPNEASNAVPIAEMLEEAGVYWMSHWNKPADVHPWDYKYWVAHTAADDVTESYNMAKLMFEEIGGEGTAVHIQGMLGNTAAQGREEGFWKAVEEYPGIEVLEVQGGTWDQIMAQELVEAWLAKYDQIDVIHTAGDPHALGAVAALKAVRPDLVGKVLISGFNGDEPTTQAIIDGEVFVTAGLPVAWQGAMGLAIPLAAKNGEFDPSDLPHEQREFFFNSVIITQENAQDWMDNNIKGLPDLDYTDLWGNVGAPMSP